MVTGLGFGAEPLSNQVHCGSLQAVHGAMPSFLPYGFDFGFEMVWALDFRVWGSGLRVKGRVRGLILGGANKGS